MFQMDMFEMRKFTMGRGKVSGQITATWKQNKRTKQLPIHPNTELLKVCTLQHTQYNGLGCLDGVPESAMFRSTHEILMRTTVWELLKWLPQLLSAINLLGQFNNHRDKSSRLRELMTNKKLRKQRQIWKELTAFWTWEQHKFPPHGGTPAFITAKPRWATLGLALAAQDHSTQHPNAHTRCPSIYRWHGHTEQKGASGEATNQGGVPRQSRRTFSKRPYAELPFCFHQWY